MKHNNYVTIELNALSYSSKCMPGIDWNLNRLGNHSYNLGMTNSSGREGIVIICNNQVQLKLDIYVQSVQTTAIAPLSG